MQLVPLDIVYLFRHSKHGDEELRYSLRSVAQHLPYIRKVWIFGDQPAFLTRDTTVAERVPHEYIAPLLGYKTPVRNDFLMLFLASLLPEVAHQFVRFSDDYIVLAPLTRDELCIPRALEDLNRAPTRGSGKWKQSLWRTFDILKQFSYAGYNFESHVPGPMNKKMVFEAFMAFRPFLSEERHGGMLSGTTVFNYALKRFGVPFSWVHEEQSRAAFHGTCPSEEQIAFACAGKLFLNFDDPAFGPQMLSYLSSRFSSRCRYERDI